MNWILAIIPSLGAVVCAARGIVPKPIGAERIVLGDKVLNNVNLKRTPYSAGAGLSYVANGEIGRFGKRGKPPRWTNVELARSTGSETVRRLTDLFVPTTPAP